MSGYNAALRAFKIVALGQALPSVGEVPEMVKTLLAAKRSGELMGMRGGLEDYLRVLKRNGFSIERDQ